MIDLETIFGRKTATAVDINGLLVPANSLTKHLNSYARPGLFVVPEAKPFELSKSGSITKVRFDSRYFVLCISHQISVPRYEFQELCLHNADSGMFITSHAATYSKASIREFDDDLMLFEFTDAVRSGALSTNGWFSLAIVPSDQSLEVRHVALGYPSHRNSIDYELQHYAQGPNAVWGKPCAPAMPDRRAFNIDPLIDYDPDGLSGGPVFAISFDSFKPVAYLAGIVSNGSRSTINFVDQNRIHQFLEGI